MQMLIRLYYPSDIDLIALRLRYGKRFIGIIRSCLLSAITGSEYIITVPDNLEKFVREPKEAIAVNLNFNDEYDAETIQYLRSIRSNMRSDIIKTIVRSCYSDFPISLFLSLRHESTHLIVERKVKSSKKKTKPTKESLTYMHSSTDIKVVPEVKSKPAINTKTATADSASNEEQKASGEVNTSDNIFEMFRNMIGG